MKLIASSLFLLAFVAGANAQDGPQTCNANPECAALGLADDCCPTNLAGIFLDCCEDKQAACNVNPGCQGLIDDCCPTADGSFLYCCFDEGGDGYKYDYTYFGNALGPDTATYWQSTGEGSYSDSYYEYQRNPDLNFDLLYFLGDVPDAANYVAGDKKFSIKIASTTAEPCTQIILQLEHIPFPSVDNRQEADASLFQPYPKNRHSRYLATIPENPNEQYVEFEFLDRPDDSVPDGAVNSVVLLFAPGKKQANTFTFSNLDSNSKCNGGDGCLDSPVKSCEALYLTVEEGKTTSDSTNRTRALQAEPDCSDCANPACVGVGECGIDESITDLNEDPDFGKPEVTAEGGEVENTTAPVSEGSQGSGEPADEPTSPGSTGTDSGASTEAPDSSASRFGSAIVAVVSLSLAWFGL